MANDGTRVRLTVVYALPGHSWQESLCVPAGTTLLQAVQASGFARAHPEVEVQTSDLGVYGTRCAPDRLVAEGDRVEIYRPLRFDPMQSRRRRAARSSRR